MAFDLLRARMVRSDQSQLQPPKARWPARDRPRCWSSWQCPSRPLCAQERSLAIRTVKNWRSPARQRGAFPRELVEWLNRMINSLEQARRPLLGHCPNRRARSLQSVEYSGMPLISGVERRQVSRSIKRHLGNVNGLIRSRHCHWGRDQHPSCEDTDRDGERCSDER
jgi:hypothetical protein